MFRSSFVELTSVGKVSRVKHHISKGTNSSGRWHMAVAIFHGLRSLLAIELRRSFELADTRGQLDQAGGRASNLQVSNHILAQI